MVKPAAKKKPIGNSYQQHKKSYYKYKKLLRKEGLGFTASNNSIVGGKESTAPVNENEKVNVEKNKTNRGTNRLLQTYGRVKENKMKDDLHKKRQEQKEMRLGKIKLKKEKHNRLNKWTKKGQPVMKNRMELMLDKIMSDKDTYC